MDVSKLSFVLDEKLMPIILLFLERKFGSLDDSAAILGKKKIFKYFNIIHFLRGNVTSILLFAGRVAKNRNEKKKKNNKKCSEERIYFINITMTKILFKKNINICSEKFGVFKT